MGARSVTAKVSCLTTGVVRERAGDRGFHRYLGGDWNDQTLPVHVFVIEHSEGVCVFDSGQSARAASPGYLPVWHPFLRLARFELGPEEEAGAQLHRRGIEPGGVRWLVLSHLHTDHVGGVDAFPGAEILVSRTEWELARGWPGRLRGYLPQHWPAAITPTLVDFRGPPLGPFPASLDLSGDGGLVLVPAPGHTAGHMALVVRTGSGGFFCCGDLVHCPAELPERFPAIAAFCRDAALTVLATHDPHAPGLI